MVLKLIGYVFRYLEVGGCSFKFFQKMGGAELGGSTTLNPAKNGPPRIAVVITVVD